MFGYGLESKAEYQSVFGRCYATSTENVVIGCGADEANRLDGITISTLGDVQAPNSTVPNVKSLTTKEYVDGLTTLAYVTLTAAATASANEYIYADTVTTGAFTITMPDSPAANDQFYILDVKGSFDTANVTLAQAVSAETIMGLSESFLLDVKNNKYNMIYTGNDWRVI